MGDNKKYTLKSGTVLDNRYVIEEVLGEGGFGITYRGMHKSIGMTVAVKEFFSKDIMTRNVDETEEVSLIWDENKDRFEREKNKFLKEARIISDFSKEDGVVHIMDYFEANNTVYIVMEYIEGESLRDYVNKHGAFSVDDVISKMMPVITTLGKINDCGVIHRDIGPNNIMVEKDGSFRLIDFGSARDYEAMDEKSYSVVLTGGYAPPEQYDKNGHLGPWTDVYAVCAVIYFCITGYSPQEGVSRLLYDELEKPSDRGVKIKSEIERIIIKGLSVNPKDRYQSMEELAKDLTPQVKVKKEQNSNKKAFIVGISVAALAILISASIFFGNKYYQEHKEEIMFDDGKVQHFILKPTKNTTVKQFNDAKEVVERRLKVLTDDKYILEQDDDKLRITIDSDIIGKEEYYNLDADAKTFIERHITGSYELFAFGVKEDGNHSDKNCFKLDYKDIESVSVKPGLLKELDIGDYFVGDKIRRKVNKHLEIKLKKKTAKKLKKLPKRVDLFKVDNNGDPSLCFTTVADSKNGTLNIQLRVNNEKIVKLLKSNLTSKSSKKTLSIATYDNYVKWEDVGNTIEKGENQVNEDKLTGKTETFLYYYGYGENDKMTKGQYYSSVVDLKERMDGLGIKYSFGTDIYRDRSIAIRVAKDDVNTYIMKKHLIEDDDYQVNIAKDWKEKPLSKNGNEISVFGSGKDRKIKIKFMADKAEIKKWTKKISKKDNKKLFLKIGPYDVAYKKITKPIKNGTFLFNNNITKNSNLNYFDYIRKFILDTTMDAHITCSYTYWHDGDKLIIVKKKNINDLHGIEKRYKSDKKKIKRLSSNLKVDPLNANNNDGNSNTLTIHFKKIGKGKKGIKKMVSTCHKVVDKLDLLDGTYDKIEFYLPDKGKMETFNHIEITKDTISKRYLKDIYFYSSTYKVDKKTFVKYVSKIFKDVKWNKYSVFK